MDNSLFMSRRQSMCNLNAVFNHLAHRYRAVLQQLPQSVALHQLGHQIGCALEGSKMVNRKNVGMIESRGRLRLLLKTMPASSRAITCARSPKILGIIS
jgi:hypothetical protein